MCAPVGRDVTLSGSFFAFSASAVLIAPVIDHLVEHPVAPLERAVLLPERIVVVRRLRQRREIGRFRDGQLVHRLVEIEQRRRGHAVGAEAEIDFVEIELEDLFLGIGALDLEREQRLLDLALERDLVGQKEVLGDLLGDGGGALRTAARSIGLHIEHAGADDAAEVETVVLVEILVFGGEEGVDHHLRHGLDRNDRAGAGWRIRRPASRRRHGRASSPAARSPAIASSPAGPWRNARADRRAAPTPTRNMIVPAANRKPQKRSSSLIAKFPSGEIPSAPDGCRGRATFRQCHQPKAEHVVPPGPAHRQRAHAHGGSDAAFYNPVPRKIAGFYVQTEALRSSAAPPGVAPAILRAEEIVDAPCRWRRPSWTARRRR